MKTSSILAVAVISAAVISPACSRARIETMPINFVGDWCANPTANDPAKKSTYWYQLPSWTDGGHCTNILSIKVYDFYFTDKKLNCDPVSMRLGHNTAPSGTAYTAKITARCEPDGAMTSEGKLQNFEFYRYKGNLSVTTK